MDLAAKTTSTTVELAPAVMRDGVQRPAVLGLGWWQVASAVEMEAAESASGMAAAAVAVVPRVARVTVAASGRGSAGREVRPPAHLRGVKHTFEASSSPPPFQASPLLGMSF